MSFENGFGAGSVAEVFRAREPSAAGLDQIVYKRLLPEAALDAAFVELFLGAGRRATGISHKNLVKVFEAGTKNESEHFLVMEDLGPSLRAVLDGAATRSMRLPPWFSVYLIAEVLQGVAHLHESGGPVALHLDVTPSNIFVSHTGEVSLGEPGTAKASARRWPAYLRAMRANLPYLAPEQVRGLAPDPRTDVFVAGVVLWECLVQARLFAARNERETMDNITTATRTAPSLLAPDVPRSLDTLVLTAIAPEPERRFASARQMLDRLLETLKELRPDIRRVDIRELTDGLLGRLVAQPRFALPRFASSPEGMPPNPWAGEEDVALDEPLSSDAESETPGAEDDVLALTDVEAVEELPSFRAASVEMLALKPPSVSPPPPDRSTSSSSSGLRKAEASSSGESAAPPAVETPPPPATAPTPPAPVEEPAAEMEDMGPAWADSLPAPRAKTVQPEVAQPGLQAPAGTRADPEPPVPSTPAAPSTKAAGRQRGSSVGRPDVALVSFRAPSSAKPRPLPGQPPAAESASSPSEPSAAAKDRAVETSSSASARPAPDPALEASSSSQPGLQAARAPEPGSAPPRPQRSTSVIRTDAPLASFRAPSSGMARLSGIPAADPAAPAPSTQSPQPAAPAPEPSAVVRIPSLQAPSLDFASVSLPTTQPSLRVPTITGTPAAPLPPPPDFLSSSLPITQPSLRPPPDLVAAPVRAPDPTSASGSTSASRVRAPSLSMPALTPPAVPGTPSRPSLTPPPIPNLNRPPTAAPESTPQRPSMAPQVLDGAAPTPQRPSLAPSGQPGAPVARPSLAPTPSGVSMVAMGQPLSPPTTRRERRGSRPPSRVPPPKPKLSEPSGPDAEMERAVADAASEPEPEVRPGPRFTLTERYEGDHPFWVRDPNAHVVGPMGYDHLRYLAAEVEDARGISVSADRERWIELSAFAILTGQELLLDRGRAKLPKKSPSVGNLRNRSLLSVFGGLARERATGRLLITDDFHGKSRRHVQLERGRPTFVYANVDSLQLPAMLTQRQLVTDDQLPDLIHQVVTENRPLKEVLSRAANMDQWHPMIMRDRLAEFFGWRVGRYHFDPKAGTEERLSPFAPSLWVLLPEMVLRTFNREALQRLLAPKMDVRLERTPRWAEEIEELALSPPQRDAAELVGRGRPITACLKGSERDERVVLAMAYTLTELELLVRPL